MIRPALTLQRNPDGSYKGDINEGHRQVTFRGTPDEIVQQWEDRYAERPLSLALTEVERGMLVDLLRHEARVVEGVGGPPLRVVLLNRLATRLEALE